MAEPVTIVETNAFLAATRKLMSEEGRAALVDYLARNPLSGDVIPGTGGLRKLRWTLEGRGKRGGARVIYYFHHASIPVFLVSAYAKNERDNLSDAERNEFRKLTKILAETYGT
jgi:hypothetical protein